MKKSRDGGNGKKTGGKKKKKMTDENSGHYVIASSRPPERRPLERRTLAPIQVTSTASIQPLGHRATGTKADVRKIAY